MFQNNFWSEDEQGFLVLDARLKQGKKESKELLALFKQKSAFETSFGNQLLSLCHKSDSSLNQLITKEMEIVGHLHLDLGEKLKLEVCKPLEEYIADYSIGRKQVSQTIQTHLKPRIFYHRLVLELKEKFEKAN
jgi:hypothetical protein